MTIEEALVKTFALFGGEDVADTVLSAMGVTGNEQQEMLLSATAVLISAGYTITAPGEQE